MISSLLSRVVILVFGTLYPAYRSYKAVKTKSVRDYVKWMMYWIVFALFLSAETFADLFVSWWMPFYYEIKIVFLLWLLSPYTKGSSVLYRRFVHPMLSEKENEIDDIISRAKQEGYKFFLQIGSQGFVMLTSLAVQLVTKGPSLLDQLRSGFDQGGHQQRQPATAVDPPPVASALEQHQQRVLSYEDVNDNHSGVVHHREGPSNGNDDGRRRVENEVMEVEEIVEVVQVDLVKEEPNLGGGDDMKNRDDGGGEDHDFLVPSEPPVKKEKAKAQRRKSPSRVATTTKGRKKGGDTGLLGFETSDSETERDANENITRQRIPSASRETKIPKATSKPSTSRSGATSGSARSGTSRKNTSPKDEFDFGLSSDDDFDSRSQTGSRSTQGTGSHVTERRGAKRSSREKKEVPNYFEFEDETD